MRKSIMFAAVAAAALFAGAASAQTITPVPVQTNDAPQTSFGLVVGDRIGRDLGVTTQAVGNDLAFTATDYSTTTRNIRVSNIRQTNTGDQTAVSVVALADIDREAVVSTQAIANNISTKGEFAADNGGRQFNSGDQTAISAVGLVSVERDLSIESASIANNAALTGGVGSMNLTQGSSGVQLSGTLLVGADVGMSADVVTQSVGNSLRSTYEGKGNFRGVQSNSGLQVGVSLVGYSAIADDLDISTGAFGNSLNSTVGVTENKADLADQFSAGAQLAFTGVGMVDVGRDLTISTNAIGNAANFTGPTSSSLSVTQINVGPQVAVSALIGSTIAGNVSVNTTSVGNTASFTSAPRP